MASQIQTPEGCEDIAQLVKTSAHSTENPKGRNQSIDTLKGFGIIAVIFLHLPQVSQNPDNLLLQLLSVVARFAIPCFFMISGYFFRLSWEKREDKFQLLLDRYIRIVPIFLFWALFYAVVPPHIGAGTWEHLRGIVLYPHSFILTGGVYHLWFLSSLLQGLTILWLALRFRAMPAALVLGGVLYVMAHLGMTQRLSPNGYPHAGPFSSVLSVLIGALLTSKTAKVDGAYAASLCILGVAANIGEFFFFNIIRTTVIEKSMMVGLIPLALGMTVFAISGKMDIKWFAAIGRYSLGIYLIHPWLLQSLKIISPPLLHTRSLTLTLSLTLSFLFVDLFSKACLFLRKL